MKYDGIAPSGWRYGYEETDAKRLVAYDGDTVMWRLSVQRLAENERRAIPPCDVTFVRKIVAARTAPEIKAPSGWSYRLGRSQHNVGDVLQCRSGGFVNCSSALDYHVPPCDAEAVRALLAHEGIGPDVDGANDRVPLRYPFALVCDKELGRVNFESMDAAIEESEPEDTVVLLSAVRVPPLPVPLGK